MALAMLKFTLASTSSRDRPWSAQVAAHRCSTCTALGWRWLAITMCSQASACAIACPLPFSCAMRTVSSTAAAAAPYCPN